MALLSRTIWEALDKENQDSEEEVNVALVEIVVEAEDSIEVEDSEEEEDLEADSEEEVEIMIADQRRCMMQHAVSAEKHVRFHLSQQGASQFYAVTVSGKMIALVTTLA